MSDEKQKPKAITTHDVEAPRPVVREHPPALTTNKIQPQLPTYPEEGKRRPAKGPIITTGNIEQIQAQNAAAAAAPVETPNVEPQQKKGRAQKG